MKHALREAVQGEAEEAGEGPVQQGGEIQGQVESLHLQEVGAADPLEHLAGELQQQLQYLPGPSGHGQVDQAQLPLPSPWLAGTA